ncbi:DUF3099 domain-containing protein [Pilimelia columellifera]|uniref:DUF3099 domain-containing protein n=1 Tax=Pilimelia columellifera subsp. columellifera TaxID=706583 RepID=A0ABP6ADZ2_9ACTN
MRPRAQPTLITDAETSPDDQLRSRKRKYLIMMGIRIACLIVGAVLATAEAPLLWLWLSVCAVAMVLLPWLAVMVANDRPPKDQHRLRRNRVAATTSPKALPTERPGPVIDV